MDAQELEYVGRLEQEVDDLRKALRVVREVSGVALMSEEPCRPPGVPSYRDQ